MSETESGPQSNGLAHLTEAALAASPSAAAGAITETTVNGWRFWEGRLPGDKGWRRLDVVRNTYSHG